MAKVEIQLNEEAVGQLLRGEEVREMISGMAQTVANNAGEGYGHREHDSGQRIIANIYPETKEAFRDNLQNNTLLKGLHL